MNSIFAIQYHSPRLNMPLFDPHGIANAGLLTLSRFKVDTAERISYPVASDFSKLFDLDRCFSVERIPVEGGKTLVLINSHMSAYDEGGIIRAQQLEKLNTLISDEYNKGNWVIVGGDFSIVKPENGMEESTCRSADSPYIEGVNYTTIVDGFIVSDNVEAKATIYHTGYEESDHQPVVLSFTLL